LLPLPATPFPTEERREVAVGKTPYVRFDGNDYSVPHELVRRTVVVLAGLETLRLLHEGAVVAEHRRSFDRHRQIEDPAHIQGLVAFKRQAREHRGFDRLAAAAPESRELLNQLAQRGSNLGHATVCLLRLLDEFGPEHFQRAVCEALRRGTPHHHAVRQILETGQRAAGERPVIPVELPDDPRVRDLVVRPHPLESYDALAQDLIEHKEDDDDDRPITIR
jgi:hypothetical protein